jgi:hypothetical protein
VQHYQGIKTFEETYGVTLRRIAGVLEQNYRQEFA